MVDESEVADAVIVGAGPGALVAALVLRGHGLDPLIVEKTEYVGGTTALSGGAIWFPANPLMRADGEDDSVDAGVEYLEAVAGDGGHSASPARRRAYVEHGVRMVEFLLERGLRFRRLDFPDYYPEAPGGRGRPGRALVVPMFDARRLGDAAGWVRPRPPLPMGLVVDTLEDLLDLVEVGYSWRARWAAVRLALRTVAARARGVEPLVLGAAQIGRLLEAVLADGIRVRLRTPLCSLVMEDDRVAGVVVEQDGRRVRLSARHGVLLNAGGFTHNGEMRAAYGPNPASTDWTATIPADTGDGVGAAVDIGAATALLDEYYWYPTAIMPGGPPGTAGARAGGMLIEPERHLPHSMIVDSSGSRYLNEASDYMAIGRRMYERHRTVPAIPSWLIMDSRHRRRYPFGLARPGQTPKEWLSSGFMKRSDTIAGLATHCGIDPDGLQRTVDRFNQMAEAGEDEDFHRGRSAYDRRYSDPRMTNPCLGPVSRPPFYAVEVLPGDVGCAGGLLTDEHGRVLREVDGPPIGGLYACGTTAASAMGHTYTGGGMSIGQSMVFGFLAGEDIACRAKGTGVS